MLFIKDAIFKTVKFIINVDNKKKKECRYRKDLTLIYSLLKCLLT